MITSQPPNVWSTLKPSLRPPIHHLITTEHQQIPERTSDPVIHRPNVSVQVTTYPSQPPQPSGENYDEVFDPGVADISKDLPSPPSTIASSTITSTYPRTTCKF